MGLKIFSTLITAHGFPCFSLEPSDGLTMLPQFHMWPVEGRSTAPLFPSQQVGSTSSKKNPAGLRRKSELSATDAASSGARIRLTVQAC